MIEKIQMKSLFFLLLVLIPVLSYTQDVIVYNTGEKVNVKALFVTPDVLIYKAWDDLDGPDLNLDLSKLFMITFENGTLVVFNKQVEKGDGKAKDSNESALESQDEKSPSQDDVIRTVAKMGWISQREGLHLGFHISAGLGGVFGTTSYFDDALGTVNTTYSPEFGVSGGIDIKYNFNQYLGFATGVNFENINYKTEVDVVKYTNFSSHSYFSVTNLGLPLKFSLTTGRGKNIGFFLETGLLFTVPVASNYNQTIYYNGDYDLSSGSMEDVSNSISLSTQSVVGVNVPFSSNANFSFGGFVHYSITEYYTNDVQSYVLLYGLQVGLSFNKKK